MLWGAAPETQFCAILIESLHKLIDEALHNSPIFSCGPLEKLITHPCSK